MSINITGPALQKLFAGLTEFLDSKHRGQDEMLHAVKTFSVQSACNTTDNFMSAIYNVKCMTEFEKQQKRQEFHDLIFKAQIIGDGDSANASDAEKYYWNVVFTKEKIVYEEILEKIEALDSNHEFALAPKMHHYYTEGETYSCLMLDNLISLGYYIPKTLEGDSGLSLYECKIIVKNLAKLHASSLVLEGKDGQPLPKKYEICVAELFLSPNLEPVMRPMVQNSFLGVISLAEKFRPDLAIKLKKLNEDQNIWSRLCELILPGKSSFSCLCHGDPRLNNVFIQKDHSADNASSLDPQLRFIDFQLTRYGAPAQDLQYLLNTGTSKEFRSQHLNSILETYHDQFHSVLRRFPHVPLLKGEAVRSWTLDTLRREYEDENMYGLLISLILLPVILLRPSDIDKSVSQQTAREREHFFNEGRRQLIFSVGCSNKLMRDRLFELCDEMVAKNVIS